MAGSPVHGFVPFRAIEIGLLMKAMKMKRELKTSDARRPRMAQSTMLCVSAGQKNKRMNLIINYKI